MEDKLTKCIQCDKDINRYFQVKVLDYYTNGWTIGVAECTYCGYFVPFKSRGMGQNEFNSDAIKAWNNKLKERNHEQTKSND